MYGNTSDPGSGGDGIDVSTFSLYSSGRDRAQGIVPTCSASVAAVNLANATDALVNPGRAKFLVVKDRNGNVTSLRNDGTTNAQVFPLPVSAHAMRSSPASDSVMTAL